MWRHALVALLLVSVAIPVLSDGDGSEPSLALRECSPLTKREAQPFNLPTLKLQWDSWQTSRIATAVAAILLSERLGFNVELVAAGSPSQVYHSLSQGGLHLALESWPDSNREEFERFAGPNATSSNRVEAFPYSDLFGHSGIFETCSRLQSDSGAYPQCSDRSILNSPALLKDVLDTDQGQDFFSQENPAGQFEEWVPPHCLGKNCTVEILHVNPEFDKGLIEGMVLALGLPAKVVYLGSGKLSKSVWSAYTKRAGALIYGYFPDINHYGISTLQLPRAKIPPELDLNRQQLQKLAWPGLADHRGGDALAFAEAFDLTKSDYAELVELFDLFQDPQNAACAWVKKNPSKWEKWIKFPEREHAPLMCLPDFLSNGLCDMSYFMGWMVCLLQLALCALVNLWAKYLNRPPERPDDFREKLDQKLVVSGAARFVAAWWKMFKEKKLLKEQVSKLAPPSTPTKRTASPLHPLRASSFRKRSKSKAQALEGLMRQAKAFAAQKYTAKMARKDFLQAQEAADVKAEDVNGELHQDKHSWWYAWALEFTGNFKTRVDFTTSLFNLPIVLSHIRRYDNFARSNDDQKTVMPLAGGDDRWVGDLDRGTLFTYMLLTTTDGVLPVIMNCIGLGFFSGALSTIFYQIVRQETYKTDPIAWAEGVPTRTERSYLHAIESIGNRASLLINAYAFFPTFLQMGYVVYAVGRWRGFQEMGYNLLGAINNTALLVGSAIKDPVCEASKQLAYRVYRYLTVAHILGYKQHAPSPWFEVMNVRDLVECGLLTQKEAAVLEPAQDTMHELVCSWISKEMFEGCEKGLLSTQLIVVMPTNIRASIGGIKGNLLTNQPNLWAALMRLVCDLLIVMFVIGNPAAHFMYESGSFQFYVVLYTTCQTIPYLCVHMLVQTLSNPYNSHHDMFNTDSIISWGERACFTNLRAKFHSLESNGDSHERMEGDNLEYLTSPLAMDTDLAMSREASDTASEGAFQTLLRALPDGIAPCPSEPTLLPAPVVGHRAAPDAIEVDVVLDNDDLANMLNVEKARELVRRRVHHGPDGGCGAVSGDGGGGCVLSGGDGGGGC